MERKKIEEKVREIIEKRFGKKDIKDNSEFLNGINGWDLDSLGLVRLIVEVEECFDIIVDFDEEFHTMNDLVEIIYNKLRKEEN